MTLIELPPDILRYIFNYILRGTDNNQAAKTCKRLFTFFRLSVHTNYLMQRVVREEQGAAEASAMLRIPLHDKNTITDDIGRRFSSPFKHALWSRDWNMWQMLRKYMSRETVITELQEFKDVCNTPASLARAALLQELSLEYVKAFDTLSTNDRKASKMHVLTYARGSTDHGISYDSTPLEAAYHQFITRYPDWNHKQRSDYLCEVIGFFQSMMPRFALHEIFCRPDRSNNPTPKYADEKSQRDTTSIGVYAKDYCSNLVSDLPQRNVNIFPLDPDKGLGVRYALVRDDIKAGAFGCAWPGNLETEGWHATELRNRVAVDRKAIAALREAGEMKFQELERELLTLPLKRCPTDNISNDIDLGEIQQQRFRATLA